MYKNILVPVDGSDTADTALREAIKLARSQSTGLRIINIVDSAIDVWDSEFTPIGLEQIRESARSFARNLLEKAQQLARHEGVEVETKLLEVERPGQRVAKVIVEEARRWPADLIVMGTHGRRGLDHLFLGSVAEGVMRLSPAPVLLVRERP